MEHKIIPQKFSYKKPTITDGHGKVIYPGIEIKLKILAGKADKGVVKKELETIFAEIIDYFE